MALIKSITHKPLLAHSTHGDVECTYSIVNETDGTRFLQLDTYGSATRKIPGKKSQSFRFDQGAIAQLRKIIAEYDL